MPDDPVIALFENINLILILLAFAIFARLAFKGKNIGNFRFQLSIFLIIWVLSELPHIAESIGLITIGSYEDTGLYLHAISMTVFALFVGWRSFRFLTLHPPPPVTTLSLPAEQPRGLKG